MSKESLMILSVLSAPFMTTAFGALMYVLSANPKLAELGRLEFAVGLLAMLLVLAEHGMRFVQ